MCLDRGVQGERLLNRHVEGGVNNFKPQLFPMQAH